MPESPLLVPTVLGLGLVGVLVAIYRLLRKPAAELTGMDRLFAQLFIGRHFERIHARVSARGHVVSPREGPVALAALAVLTLLVLGYALFGSR